MCGVYISYIGFYIYDSVCVFLRLSSCHLSSLIIRLVKKKNNHGMVGILLFVLLVFERFYDCYQKALRPRDIFTPMGYPKRSIMIPYRTIPMKGRFKNSVPEQNRTCGNVHSVPTRTIPNFMTIMDHLTMPINGFKPPTKIRQRCFRMGMWIS